MPAPTPETINQRFAQLIKQLGLTKNAFAQSLGKTASVIQHLMDGRNKPGYDLLYKVFEVYPNVSRDWMMLGQGPMLLTGEAMSKQPTAAPTATPELPLRAAAVPLTAAPQVAVATLPAAVKPEASQEVAPEVIVPTAAPVAAAPAPVAVAPAPAAAPISSPAPLAAAVPEVAPAVAAPLPAPVPVPAPAMPAIAPEAYVAAALHAQNLQHQLSLAEMRNQHLLEQQLLLREMLEMARKAV
jgi:plasmid maintenance system antidote protein VapI